MRTPAIILGVAAATSLALVAPAPSHAQAADTGATADLIEERIAELLEEQEIPGAAATLVVDGDVVLAEGYGTARAADGEPFAPDTLYYAASLGKLFTTAAALQLAAEGELDLDADVNDQLTGFDVPDAYPGEPITLRHLLTHTSGFEDRIQGWSRWEPEEMPSLEAFADDELPGRVRPPGELVNYNNYDMVLAGLLVEQAAGRPFAEVVQERVFDPLGMDDSAVLLDEPDPDGIAAGHRWADGQVETTGLRSPSAPAGPGYAVNAEDMARFMTAVIERDPALGDGVAEQMTTRQFGVDERMPGIGFSFQEFEAPGGGVWFKSGDISGFHNAMVVAPDAGVGFHVAFNGDGVDAAAAQHAAAALAGEVLDALGVTTATSDAPEAVDEDLEQYTGEYLATRVSRSDFTEVTRIFAPVTVSAEDGLLVTSGIAHDPASGERHWVPVGDGLFHERDGEASLLITPEGTILTSEDASVAYEPLPWYEGATVHLALMGAGALILVTGFLALTVAGVARPFRTVERGPGLRIATAWSAWLLSGAATAMLAVMAVTTADGNLMVERVVGGSPWLEVAVHLSLSAVVLTGVTAVLYLVTALRRRWTTGGAIRYGLLLLGAVLFSATLLSLNLAAL
jgi:CubicO group peptidase (beta-lactamase class C family)